MALSKFGQKYVGTLVIALHKVTGHTTDPLYLSVGHTQ